MILNKIFFNLFYPQVGACFCVAYNDFQQSRKYNRLLESEYSIQEINAIFADEDMDDYMNEAFKKEWFRIIFTPWVFVCSKEAFLIKGE
jgi:hypothetical protein